jgi:hypothetical protein
MFVYKSFMSNEYILVFSFITMLFRSLISWMEFLMLYVNGGFDISFWRFCDEFFRVICC